MKRSAFTLVELLVVVSIIALLVAILIPALRSAREQAKLVDCLSRIRQCASVSVGAYAADYKGAMPPLIGHRAGFGFIGWQIINNSGIAVRLNSTSGPDYNIGWPDLLQMYLDPRNQRDKTSFRQYHGAFYCSADWDGMVLRHGTGWWPANTESNAFFREFSWRMNPNVTPIRTTGLPTPLEGAPVYGQKFSGVRSPSQKILLVENHYEYVGGAAWGNYGANSPFTGAGLLSNQVVMRWSPTGHFSLPRHRNGLVAAYCDGSARTLTWTERTVTVNTAAVGGTGITIGTPVARDTRYTPWLNPNGMAIAGARLLKNSTTSSPGLNTGAPTKMRR